MSNPQTPSERHAWRSIATVAALTLLIVAGGLALIGWAGGNPLSTTAKPVRAIATTTLPRNDRLEAAVVAGAQLERVTPPPSTSVPAVADSDETAEAAEPPPQGRAGLLMFRGSRSRTFYGTGDLATAPVLRWRYPEQPMCGQSTVGGETRLWCGTGWTGQPAVWERPDGVIEVIFGAYDHQVHFVNGETGRPTRPPFRTGDIIKGSVTVDPDGYPLLYFGSRDNKLRILALDREAPEEIWSLDANAVDGIWNNDWDGNPAILEDVLFEGGENGWFFAVRLGRDYDGKGLVRVDPEILVAHPGYNEDLLARVGSNVSIESSVAFGADSVYFANSGGRVLGLELRSLFLGEAVETFDFWMGDDVDATVVVDEDGALYVAAELERFNDRAAAVGQIVKLDPSAPDPLVWSVSVPPRETGAGGVWATPALGKGVLYAATHPGELLAIETRTGRVTWRDEIGFHAWSSPAIVGDVLLVATCTGTLRGYSLADPAEPSLLWTVALESGACIESTPAVWNGRIYVGSRDGFFYAFDDQ